MKTKKIKKLGSRARRHAERAENSARRAEGALRRIEEIAGTEITDLNGDMGRGNHDHRSPVYTRPAGSSDTPAVEAVRQPKTNNRP